MIQPRICIAEAASRGDVELAAELMRDFLRWCRDRYAARPWQVDAYFRPAAWRRELASLDRVYAPPDGGLLLARVDGAAAGALDCGRSAGYGRSAAGGVSALPQPRLPGHSTLLRLPVGTGAASPLHGAGNPFRSAALGASARRPEPTRAISPTGSNRCDR